MTIDPKKIPKKVYGAVSGTSYEIGAMIGHGSFCRVAGIIGGSEGSGPDQPLAIKFYSNDRQFARETDICGTASDGFGISPFIEEIHDSGAILVSTNCKQSSTPYRCYPFTIMPRYYMTLGDFVRDRVKETETGLPAIGTLSVARQLFSALVELERRGVVHGDIKPGNIMIKRKPTVFNALELVDFDIVLVDFGSASTMTKQDGKYECPAKTIGTLPYAAPELLIKKPYTTAVDIWSAMAVIYYCITGDTLFDVFGENKLDCGDDLSGIYMDDDDESSPSGESIQNGSDSEAMSFDEDEESFQMLYAHIVLMYKRIGKPPESFCSLMPGFYFNGVPRYSMHMTPSTISTILAKNYDLMNALHIAQIDAFLSLGLQYMASDRKSAQTILDHPFLHIDDEEAPELIAAPSAAAPQPIPKKKAKRAAKK